MRSVFRAVSLCLMLSAAPAGAAERLFFYGGEVTADPEALAGKACANSTATKPVWYKSEAGVAANGRFYCEGKLDSPYFGEWYFVVQMLMTTGPSNCPPGQRSIAGTCTDYADPAPNAGTPCPELCGGNPINVATGNKFQREADYLGRGPFPLRFERYYNSSTALRRRGAFGMQWRHSYERALRVADGAASLAASVQVSAGRADGKGVVFTKAGGVWSARPDVPLRLAQTASGFRLTDDADTVEDYDLSGRLLRITRRDGQQQTLTYDAAGRLIEVSDGRGRSLRFEWDEFERIARMFDPAGAVTEYGYDTLVQHLETVRRPDGTQRRYHYEIPDEPALLTGITDENGARFATFGYDSAGRAISTEHAGGADRLTLSFTANGTTVTDPLGQQRTLGFGLRFGLIKPGTASGRCAKCGATDAAVAFDANGYLASRTDFGGTVTQYTRDAHGLELRRTEAVGTPQARTITTQWHAGFRLPLRITEPGREVTFAYDAQGNRTSRSVRDLATGEVRTTAWTHDALGQVLTMDGPRTDVVDLTTYAYDGDGNLTSVTNALGQTTRITAHDAHGNPLRIEDPNGVVTTLEYDARQRLVQRTVAGLTTEFEHDGVGNLTRVTLPDGSALTYGYDAAHRLTSITDSLGDRVVYTLDPLGNRIAEQVFDPAGQLVRARSRAFDPSNDLGRDEDGTGRGLSFGYDAEGKRIATTDDLGRTTATEHDALDRASVSRDALGGETRFGYDARDNLTRVVDPRGVTTDYAYDGFDATTAVQSPDAGITQYSYDSAGNRVRQIDARGVVREYRYDALDRLTAILHADPTMDVRYEYDQGAFGVGRLSAIEAPSGRTEYRYDARGNVVGVSSRVGAVTLSVGYEYDGADRMVAMTYPSGERIAYPRDGAGRILAVSRGAFGAALAAGIAHQPFGPIAGYALGDGSQVAREFDLGGRLLSQRSAIEELSWRHDPVGNIVGIDDAREPARSQAFGYDALDRLIAAAGAYGQQQFGYDGVGNRTQATLDGATTAYDYATASNRLERAGARDFEYDAAGNTVADGERLFVYDAWGRLAEVTSASGASLAAYRYNALGQRVQKSAGTPGPDYAALAAEWQARADSHAGSAAALAAQAAIAAANAAAAETAANAATEAWSLASEQAEAEFAFEQTLRADAETARTVALAAADTAQQAADVAAASASAAEQQMIEASQAALARRSQAAAVLAEADALAFQIATLEEQAASLQLEAAAQEDEATRQTELWSEATLRAEALRADEAALRAEAAALLATVQDTLDNAAWFRARKIEPITTPQGEQFNENMERQAQHFEAKVKDVTDAAAALIAEAEGLHAQALAAQAAAEAAEAASIAARLLAIQLRTAAEAALAEAAALSAQRLALLAQAATWTAEAESLEATAATQMALWSEALLEAHAQSALAAQLRLEAEAAFALASVQADAAHAAGLAAQARAVLEEQAAIAAQQLAQVYRSEQQQAAAEAAVQLQLAADAQVEADHYAALAEDPPSTYAETLFAYDLAGHLIGEYKADGTVLREYVWLDDQPLALMQPAAGLLGGVEAFYYHVDQINTPQSLTDASGQVVWAGIQQPFGEVEVTTSEVEQNLRFPGQQYDAETGLHYNYFRDYDPGLGRYRESDPLDIASHVMSSLSNGNSETEPPLTTATYAYVSSNPLRWIDAVGLDATHWLNTAGGRSRWDGPTNGNWGGRCWSGGVYSCGGNGVGNRGPTDSGDQCYQRHDNCYVRCTAGSERQRCMSACDRALVRELDELADDPRAWPAPPRPGTEADSRRFRDYARRYYR